MVEDSKKRSLMHVSKLDAAKRQLRTAIRLWFNEEDPVAIHTLAHAAHEIIHSLFKKQGLRGLLFDADIVKDEHRGAWSKAIKKNANFFKHAREDPDGKIEFNAGTNEYIILFSIYGLRRMEGKSGLEETLFFNLVYIHRQELMKKGSYDRIPVEIVEELRAIDKKDFLNIVPLAFNKLGVVFE